MRGIMVQGTSSDSGKSFIATGFCRLLSDMGYKVCPFKSQNMSNNSYVTADGFEIGRAQGVQAEAARVAARTFMNPILLKPRRDTSSEIVLFGKVFDAPCDINYYRDFTMKEGLAALREALSIIGENFDTVVAEGAGSPAEINLNSAEIVNMRVAREAGLPVVLVTDVDRGGSLASVVGTLELLGKDRERVKGIIFNKFRGSIELFKNAVEWTEKYTGVKVLGVVPWIEDLLIEGEDVLSINWNKSGCAAADIKIGVVKFPRISNHTDMEAFRFEPDVSVRDIARASDLSDLDAVILPGTKSTVTDMESLVQSGLADKIKEFAKGGGFVFGICGGYQMMGEKMLDPDRVENEKRTEIDGLSLLPTVTIFKGDKTTIRRRGAGIHPAFAEPMDVEGYEIHFGATPSPDGEDGFYPLFELAGRADGAADAEMKSAGTYLHNAFHNDKFRAFWLNNIRAAKGLPKREPFDSTRAREEAYDKLARVLRENLDMDYVTNVLLKGGSGK